MNKRTFTLRPWQMSDLDNLVKYADNPKIASNLTDAFPSPYTKTDGEAYLKMVCAQAFFAEKKAEQANSSKEAEDVE